MHPPIYTYCTKHRVTGTDIDFLRNRTFATMHDVVIVYPVTTMPWLRFLDLDHFSIPPTCHGRYFMTFALKFSAPALLGNLTCHGVRSPAFGHLRCQVSSTPYIYILHKRQSDTNRHWFSERSYFSKTCLNLDFFDTKHCTPLRGHEKGVYNFNKVVLELDGHLDSVESRVGATVVVPSWLERVPSYFGFS